MKFRDKPALQDRLAAEYVLGTLRGAARARFERWLREDAALELAVARWDARLAPMAAGVAPVKPPARLWRAIAARVGGARGATRAGGLWESAGFWRTFSLFTGGTAAALFMVVIFTAPPAPVPAPAPVVLRAPSNEMGATYLAVLTDAKTQKPMIVVSAGRSSNDLWVKPLDPAMHVADRSLELWALPRGGAPKSLGLIAAGDKLAAMKLAAAADQSLAEVPMLAVSLEPKGGSPTGAPTGPVLYTGPCIRYW
jgi:anti-sigma-K factor RskA